MNTSSGCYSVALKPLHHTFRVVDKEAENRLGPVGSMAMREGDKTSRALMFPRGGERIN